ncbi:hypothetical protein Tco_0502015 [Tanacetum coccineum]
MTTLKFVDTHNMVAFLAKPAESEGFEQIVDFLNAHTIKYALTINPTIYTSCIEQFWATVKAKTVNGEVQLQALVDGKKIIITESIVRRDLQLEDAEGVDCLPNATIFEQLTLMGYEKISQKLTFYKAFFSPQWKFLIHTILQCLSSKTTAWNEFSSTMASTIICLATNQKFNFSKAATTASSLEAEKDIGNIDNTRSKATLNEPNPQGTGSGSCPKRQDTMGDIIARTRFENVSKTSNDSLLAGVNIPRSDEDRLKLNELMEIFKKLEKKGRSRTHKLKRLYKVGRSARVISSDEASLGDQEDASKQGRKIDNIDKDAEITLVDETQGRYGDDLMFDKVTTADEVVTTVIVEISTASPTKTIIADDLTLAQTLIEIRSAKPKVKGVVIEEQRKDRLVRQREEEANIVSWDNMQAMIDADYQMAQQMQAEEQEILSIEEKSKLFVNLDARKNFAAMRAQENRNKPPTKAQKRKTISYLIKKAMKRVNTFVDMDTELVEGSKVKAEDDDKETTELKILMEVIPDEKEVALDVIPLAVNHMLKSFHREDLETLYKLVKAKYGSTRPVEDLDLFLYKDLETLFEPHVEDNVWKNQSNYRVLDWKLYDSRGVHSLRKQNVHIHMLVERRYPLTGRIVRIKRLIDDLRVTAAQLMLLVYKLLLMVLKVNVASTQVTTAQRLRLLKEFLLSEENG